LIQTDFEMAWSGYQFQAELARRSKHDIVVLNDAELAALGCVAGIGTELVLALGTGFGVALTSDGMLQVINDYGDKPFEDGTFDSQLGESSRKSDSVKWRNSLQHAISELVETHHAKSVWLVGGNAKRLKVQEFENSDVEIRIAGNEAPFRGAPSAWEARNSSKDNK
jgi:polyphosphate glucokinase